MMQNYLIGAGHFAIGFIAGYILMHYLFNQYPEKLRVQLYAPFIPMVMGIWAAIPYPFYIGVEQLPIWLHLFVFYPFFHHDELFIILLGRPAFVAVVCGVLYLFILLRYIRLAKHTRRYGWSEAPKPGQDIQVISQGSDNAR